MKQGMGANPGSREPSPNGLGPLGFDPERMRDVAAIAWLMGISDTDAEWSAKILRDCRNDEHYGDCTKAPITCNRCVCDEALEAADAAIAMETRRAETENTGSVAKP